VQWADDMGTLMHVANINKASVAGNTFMLSGVCRVPALSIGTKVKVMMGPQDSQVLGEYLITEVSHCLQSGDRYQAHFKAVYGDIEVIPGPILQAPPAETQLAVVRKNDDPNGQGRVRVQFQWQEADNMSDWIRVLSPDGGGTDAVGVNRGMVFLPEVGDQVFVSFLENNPDKPFVSGSAFHGNNSGGQSHMIRTIMTKSGNKVVMNDEQGSITVSDPSGNTWYMDGKGNINVHAPNDMTFKAGKNLNINVGENMNTSVGMNKSDSIGMNHTESIGMLKSLTIGADFMTNVLGKMVEFIKGNKESKVEKDKQTVINGKGTTQTAENHEFHSQKGIQHNSLEKTKSH
jgi:uncharacterized protein involved in type VI secretion and phage assembly